MSTHHSFFGFLLVVTLFSMVHGNNIRQIGGMTIRETRDGPGAIGVVVPDPVLPNMLSATDAFANPLMIDGTSHLMIEFQDTTADPNFDLHTDIVSLTDNLDFTITFSPLLDHRSIGVGWSTWSHGYVGDVYVTNTNSSVLSLPSNVLAFGLYVEPNAFDVYSITAMANDGTSVTQDVQGASGATLFLFYAQGSASIETVEIVAPEEASGFALGEFKYLMRPIVDGDPHFTGFHGGRYDVLGEVGRVFSILSDAKVAVNARFIQYPQDDATYMGEVGVVVGTSHLHVDTSGVLTAHPWRPKDTNTYLLDGDAMATYEGQEIVVQADGWIIRINRNTEMRNTKLIHLNVAFDTHNGKIPSGACPHGLWGQTVCRPGRSVGHGMQGEGVIDGVWSDYVIKSDDLFDTEFTYSRFQA